jgi:hypothetical protein
MPSGRGSAVGGSPSGQYESGADNRTDDAGRLQRTLAYIVAEHGVSEEATDEGTHDTDADRAEESDWITAGKNESGDGTGK